MPFGYLAGRFRGFDIRRQGSGNIGFTNVQRTMGWGWAVPVLLFDVAKGIVPVALATRLGLLPALVGLGAVCGHVFCPWLGLHGGKGVATTIGVSAFVCPRSLLVGLGTYLVVLIATGFVSVSSLAFALMLPPLTALLYRNDPWLLAFTIGLSLIILLRHRANIERLTHGTEPRLALWIRLFRRRPPA